MPRKYFKKFLPSHESIRGNRFIRRLGPILRHPNLWHLNRRSVAGGVAIGAFAGLMGGPVQMLVGALLAIRFRVNVPVAVATTWYTNPFTAVPLTYLAFKIGALVTGQNDKPIAHFQFDWASEPWLNALPAFFHWLLSLGPSFLLGVFLLALILAALGYLSVRLLWRLHVVMNWRRRKHRRSRHHS